MAVLIDSYSETNAGFGGPLDITGAAIGQSFTATGGLLDSVIVYLWKSGSPTGNMYIKIYAHSGTFGTSSVPTGSPLASSDAFDVSTLTTSGVNKTLTFSGASKINLLAATKYCLVATYDGDATNYIIIGYDEVSPTHDGNKFYYFGGWNAQSGQDVCFYVYKENPVTGPFPTSRLDIM